MILWADSFDHYGVDETHMTDGPWAEVGTGWTISTAQARTGTHSMFNIGGGTDALRRVFGAALSSVGVGFAMYCPALPSSNGANWISEFRDAANVPQVSLILQTTGALAVVAGRGVGVGSGTYLATSTALVTANSWNHIEMFSHCDGAIGTVEVRLNGVTVVNVAAVNTNPTATGEFSQWASNGVTSASGGSRYVDDIIAWDTNPPNNDFIGDKKVVTQFPDADTADVAWTPSSGVTRWAMVDEPDPDDDATYAEAVNSGDMMGVSFPDVPAATVAIAAIILCNKSRKTDAGPASLQASLESGGTVQNGATRPMTTLYTVYTDVFDTDPNTGAPWTPAAANAHTARLARTA